MTWGWFCKEPERIPVCALKFDQLSANVSALAEQVAKLTDMLHRHAAKEEGEIGELLAAMRDFVERMR